MKAKVSLIERIVMALFPHRTRWNPPPTTPPPPPPPPAPRRVHHIVVHIDKGPA